MPIPAAPDGAAEEADEEEEEERGEATEAGDGEWGSELRAASNGNASFANWSTTWNL